ncbi:hypothetical protein PCOAH_00031780 [Plasmodium coatneyi]|uniref:Uncharacterized protein n=1 Tax=Plasmodium coatneyi TaxID=208452 RepID=A0A1B1E2J5_9APIC|nr:hypothetical protein PCOAH_00031780 [Plasmodium coatneyi]ANQ09120.1 hypothetical protein PCOAH_00031780 [Plasmodium coatneyi]
MHQNQGGRHHYRKALDLDLDLELVQHNLLPSWFSNHFGGGSSKIRKRKKKTTRSNFDAFTEYTSTENGTSTIGSTTIADSTTDDHSTIYNGRRRDGPGNISYQRM